MFSIPPRKVIATAAAIVVLGAGSMIGATHANAATATPKKGSMHCTSAYYLGPTIESNSHTFPPTSKMSPIRWGKKGRLTVGHVDTSAIKGFKGQYFIHPVTNGNPVVSARINAHLALAECNLYKNGKKVKTVYAYAG